MPLGGHPGKQCRHGRRVVVVVAALVAAVVDVVANLRQQKPLGGPLLDWWRQKGSGVLQGRAPVSLPLVRRGGQLRGVRHRRASEALESGRQWVDAQGNPVGRSAPLQNELVELFCKEQQRGHSVR